MPIHSRLCVLFSCFFFVLLFLSRVLLRCVSVNMVSCVSWSLSDPLCHYLFTCAKNKQTNTRTHRTHWIIFLVHCFFFVSASATNRDENLYKKTKQYTFYLCHSLIGVAKWQYKDYKFSGGFFFLSWVTSTHNTRAHTHNRDISIVQIRMEWLRIWYLAAVPDDAFKSRTKSATSLCEIRRWFTIWWSWMAPLSSCSQVHFIGILDARILFFRMVSKCFFACFPIGNGEQCK